MLERMKGAVLLDADTYELVEHDQRYLSEAAIIVAVTSVLTGLGAWFATGRFAGFISLLIVGFLGWFVWAGITLWVGTRFFGGTADMGEMLRVLGFARSPMVLAVIPFVGLFVGSVWSLVASVVAIRQGLDFKTSDALLTALVGWLVLLIAQAILTFAFG